MKVTQVYDIVNTATKAVLGETAVVNEDLSNIVDIGRSVLGADDKEQIFNGALWDKFYMVVFGGDREVSEKFEHLYRSAPEYGALLQKISSKDIPEAEVDETWTARGGDSIDQDIVYDDNITSKVWSWKSNFMIPRTVFDRQLKGAFNGRDEMVGFLNWMELRVRQSMTVKVNILGRMCVNNMIGHVVHTANANRFVNVLALYNGVYTTAPETAAKCLYNPDFIRFFMRTRQLVIEHLKEISKLFNEEGYARVTYADNIKEVVLADLVSSVKNYIRTDSRYDYDQEAKTEFSSADVVSYFQSPGTSYAFADVSTVNVKTTSGDTVNQSGILDVIYDEKAMGLYKVFKKVSSHYNDKAEFTNFWYKFEAGVYNFLDENMVVLYVQDSGSGKSLVLDKTTDVAPVDIAEELGKSA